MPLSLSYSQSHIEQCDEEMRDNENLLGKFSDEYEKLYPSMLAS